MRRFSKLFEEKSKDKTSETEYKKSIKNWKGLIIANFLLKNVCYEIPELKSKSKLSKFESDFISLLNDNFKNNLDLLKEIDDNISNETNEQKLYKLKYTKAQAQQKINFFNAVLKNEFPESYSKQLIIELGRIIKNRESSEEGSIKLLNSLLIAACYEVNGKFVGDKYIKSNLKSYLEKMPNLANKLFDDTQIQSISDSLFYEKEKLDELLKNDVKTYPSMDVLNAKNDLFSDLDERISKEEKKLEELQNKLKKLKEKSLNEAEETTQKIDASKWSGEERQSFAKGRIGAIKKRLSAPDFNESEITSMVEELTAYFGSDAGLSIEKGEDGQYQIKSSKGSINDLKLKEDLNTEDVQKYAEKDAEEKARKKEEETKTKTGITTTEEEITKTQQKIEQTIQQHNNNTGGKTGEKTGEKTNKDKEEKANKDKEEKKSFFDRIFGDDDDTNVESVKDVKVKAEKVKSQKSKSEDDEKGFWATILNTIKNIILMPFRLIDDIVTGRGDDAFDYDLDRLERIEKMEIQLTKDEDGSGKGVVIDDKALQGDKDGETETETETKVDYEKEFQKIRDIQLAQIKVEDEPQKPENFDSLTQEEKEEFNKKYNDWKTKSEFVAKSKERLKKDHDIDIDEITPEDLEKSLEKGPFKMVDIKVNKETGEADFEYDDEGEDEEDTEAIDGEDNKDVEELDLDNKSEEEQKKVIEDAMKNNKVNPAKLFKRRKRKDGKGTTRSYYCIKNKEYSLSPEEYKEKMKKYKEAKKSKTEPKEPKTEPKNEARLISLKRYIFENWNK